MWEPVWPVAPRMAWVAIFGCFLFGGEGRGGGEGFG